MVTTRRIDDDDDDYSCDDDDDEDDDHDGDGDDDNDDDDDDDDAQITFSHGIRTTAPVLVRIHGQARDGIELSLARVHKGIRFEGPYKDLIRTL